MNRDRNVGALLTRAELIHTPEAVQAALDAMAAEVEARMAGHDPVLLAVMTGGLYPAVWLSSRFGFPHQVDYVHVTRYEGETRGGQIRWRARPRLNLRGRAVLIVDDILDEGLTLAAIEEYCRAEGAADVRTAVLVEKIHDRNRSGVVPDFRGLQVPDRYVFGCGMDYREYFRNLPAIYALPESETNS